MDEDQWQKSDYAVGKTKIINFSGFSGFISLSTDYPLSLPSRFLPFGTHPLRVPFLNVL